MSDVPKDRVNEILDAGGSISFQRPPNGGDAWIGHLTLPNGAKLSHSAIGPEAVAEILRWAAEQVRPSQSGQMRLEGL